MNKLKKIEKKYKSRQTENRTEYLNPHTNQWVDFYSILAHYDTYYSQASEASDLGGGYETSHGYDYSDGGSCGCDGSSGCGD